MTAKEMLYEFELSADKVSSKNTMNLSLPAKITYLNRGQRSLILDYYDGNNPTREAFEETRKRKEQLSVLVVLNESLPLSTDTTNVFTGDLSKTEKPFMLLLGQTAFGSKGKAMKQRIKLDDTRIDELQEALWDPFRKPDFRWRSALMTTADNKLNVYTDAFRIDLLLIDYLRHPRKIDLEGYIGFDGKPSISADCELPLLLHDEVVNYAVLNLKADLGDPAYQTALFKQQQTA